MLNRGVYSDKKQAVKPGVPGFLPALEVPADREDELMALRRSYLSTQLGALIARVEIGGATPAEREASLTRLAEEVLPAI